MSDKKPSQIDYAEIPEHLLGSICKDDPAKWATAFCQHHAKYGGKVDEFMMVGWFANAIHHPYRCDCK